MKKSVLFLMSLLLVISCNKYKDGDFSGIIVNDIYGNVTTVLGEDDGDWQFGDIFPGKVEALFEEDFTEDHSLINNVEFKADTVESGIIPQSEYFMAYPTLTNDVLNFHCRQSKDQRTLQMVIVDSDYTPLLRYAYTFPSRGSLAFSTNLQHLALLDQINRVYYKFIDAENAAICGHGDIVVSDDPNRYLDIN